jgi:hypothetical protein
MTNCAVIIQTKKLGVFQPKTPLDGRTGGYENQKKYDEDT